MRYLSHVDEYLTLKCKYKYKYKYFKMVLEYYQVLHLCMTGETDMTDITTKR